MTTKYYYKSGEILNSFDPYLILHRDDDLPAIESDEVDNEWWVDGKRHRENLPAVFYADGGREYFENGISKGYYSNTDYVNKTVKNLEKIYDDSYGDFGKQINIPEKLAAAPIVKTPKQNEKENTKSKNSRFELLMLARILKKSDINKISSKLFNDELEKAERQCDPKLAEELKSIYNLIDYDDELNSKSIES